MLRMPKREDLDDLLELINSLVEEEADIYVTKKLTRMEEAEWLNKVLSRIEKGEVFITVAEVNGKVVASANLQIRSKNEKEIGLIGIIVEKGYRNLGLGTEILKTILEQAARHKLKTVTLSVFSTNDAAIHVYRKVGFVQTEIAPKKHFRRGRFIDEIKMTKIVS